jgi:hypothetical protein
VQTYVGAEQLRLYAPAGMQVRALSDPLVDDNAVVDAPQAPTG